MPAKDLDFENNTPEQVLLDLKKSYDNHKLDIRYEHSDIDKYIKKLINATVSVPICFSTYDAEPARPSVSDIHGGLLALATTTTLNPEEAVQVTKGIGKIIILVSAIAAGNFNLKISGTSVDRNTGVTTANDSEEIFINSVSIDNSYTDTNGNTVYDFSKGYITSKWWVGTIDITTIELDITLDVYHCSFEQFNDSPNIVLNTFDVNLFTTNVAAEFDAYLYDLHVVKGRVQVEMDAELHVGAGGETAIANKYWRLRRGNLDEEINGLTDGIFVEAHYSNSPTYIEDVTLKVWATKAVPINL